MALRVVGSDAAMVVLVINDGTVQFHSYVPNDDSDGDGVPNTLDAFPLDPAASVDTDHDGYPDAWNAGMSQADSTTGLTLDAFPNDSACYLPAHGNGGVCNYGATIPNYVPDQVVSDGDVDLPVEQRPTGACTAGRSRPRAYLNPYVVGINQGFSDLAPDRMAYSSSHQRLYLGYSNGAIQYIDTGAPNGEETPFGNTALGVGGLAAVGNFLLAQDFSGAWATHYIFNAAGTITDQMEWNYYSREYAWDPVTSRVYFFRDDTSPNDLHYEVIDQASGQITNAGETPYHGDYNIEPPIRVSPDGTRVLLGTGDLYRRSNLTWAGALGRTFTDAEWQDNLLVTVNASAQLEIWDPDTLRGADELPICRHADPAGLRARPCLPGAGAEQQDDLREAAIRGRGPGFDAAMVGRTLWPERLERRGCVGRSRRRRGRQRDGVPERHESARAVTEARRDREESNHPRTRSLSAHSSLRSFYLKPDSANQPAPTIETASDERAGDKPAVKPAKVSPRSRTSNSKPSAHLTRGREPGRPGPAAGDARGLAGRWTDRVRPRTR